MLTLPIKKQWFDMIKSGKKKEEYRTWNDYYATRFFHAGLADEEGTPTKNTAMIILRNGYRKDSPKLKVIVKLSVGTGNPYWGAEPGRWYYVLRIIDTVKTEKPI